MSCGCSHSTRLGKQHICPKNKIPNVYSSFTNANSLIFSHDVMFRILEYSVFPWEDLWYKGRCKMMHYSLCKIDTDLKFGLDVY